MASRAAEAVDAGEEKQVVDADEGDEEARAADAEEAAEAEEGDDAAWSERDVEDALLDAQGDEADEALFAAEEAEASDAALADSTGELGQAVPTDEQSEEADVVTIAAGAAEASDVALAEDVGELEAAAPAVEAAETNSAAIAEDAGEYVRATPVAEVVEASEAAVADDTTAPSTTALAAEVGAVAPAEEAVEADAAAPSAEEEVGSGGPALAADVVEAAGTAGAGPSADEVPQEPGADACSADSGGSAAGACSVAAEPPPPQGCKKPETYCTHSGAVYSERDCDGDGIVDHFCQDMTGSITRGIAHGFLSSKHDCHDTWPLGGCDRTCLIPLLWCRGQFDNMTYRDCDGDGILDPYCKNAHGASFLGSALGCADNYPFGGSCGDIEGVSPLPRHLTPPSPSPVTAARPSTPPSRSPACPKPEWWCNFEGAMYIEKDCDNDGVPDPHCSHGPRSGFLSSAHDCQDTWPIGGCNGTCPHSETWCSEPGQVHSDRDCDGDGISDPLCESKNGSSVFLSSVGGCAKATDCLANLPPGACKRPTSWCQGGSYFREDCDFDGIQDPVCIKDGHFVGFVGSASGCNDTVPNGGCNGTCLRPDKWCSAPDKLWQIDCDGDGLVDPWCDAGDKQWCVSSANGCQIQLQEDGPRLKPGCRRPRDWCTGPNETFTHRDFDFDGKLDAGCWQPGKDLPIGLLSIVNCQEAEVVGDRCARKTTWCEDKFGSPTHYQADCDRDGIPDLVCPPAPGKKIGRFVSSAHSCNTIWWRYTCRSPWTPRSMQEKMFCPDPDGVCPRTPRFCPPSADGNYSLIDGDGDGIEDPSCVWKGWLGLRNCAILSSRFSCSTLWLQNCTEITPDLAARSLPPSILQRANYYWYSFEKDVGCSMRTWARTIGKQGRVLWRTIVTRGVVFAGFHLFVAAFLSLPARALKRSCPETFRSASARDLAICFTAIQDKFVVGVWVCLLVALDHTMWRTALFRSGIRESLGMMEASFGATLLVDASVLIPRSLAYKAAELLLKSRTLPRPAAFTRLLLCVSHWTFWPLLESRNWAMRYVMLQLVGDMVEAVEAVEWLLRRLPWRFAATACTAVRVILALLLRVVLPIAGLRSLWLHPPGRHLWRSPLGEEDLPLVGRELMLLNVGCFVLPFLALLDYCVFQATQRPVPTKEEIEQMEMEAASGPVNPPPPPSAADSGASGPGPGEG